ncbi:MAG: hypothetical protein HYT47_00525, partial [Candidatus Vogelbacteria bacterium]|nr:hypothetical protein [Candidatus Vogelbacteria bacterium]
SGGTLGRGGIPPTPPFRRALASGISAKKSGGYKIRKDKLKKSTIFAMIVL